MPGNISAGRLCRRACFEFVSQTSSTHRLKEDLEPLPARPAPHARSCLSAKRVQNATWEAAAAGGPGGGGSLRPEPVALPGRVPRPRGVEEEIPRESETDQRAQADRGGDQPGARTLPRWRRLDGGLGGGENSASPNLQPPASWPLQTAFKVQTCVLEAPFQDLPARCCPWAVPRRTFWGYQPPLL